MNFEKLENYFKRNKFTSIILSLLFVLGLFFQFTDYYKRIVSYFFEKEIDLKIEMLNVDKRFVHVNSATSRKSPYISSIGSWYKFRLTNNGKEAYSLVNVLYNDKQNISVFQNYYVKEKVIHLSRMFSLPRVISVNESIELYAFIIFEIEQNLGRKLFQIMYKKDKKLDTYIELYLFGKEPKVESAVIPMYNNGKFVRTVPVQIEVTNWDEHYAHRQLFKNYNYEKDLMKFDHNFKDGFIYSSSNEILSKIIEPTIDEVNINEIYKNKKTNKILISFVTNNKKFTKELKIDSTGLMLSN